MPVRRATAVDIPLIASVLDTAGVPYEAPQAPDPPVEGEDAPLPSWLSSENEYVYVDTVARSVCRISVDHGEEVVVVVWHLPDTLPQASMMPVLRGAILGLVAEHPEVSGYLRYADHFNEATSHKWRDVIPGSTVVHLLTDPPRWRIIMPPPPVSPDDAPLVRDTIQDWPTGAVEP